MWQLEELRQERGDRVEDGAIAPDKPLVEVLAEAKEAKEASFQAVWKSMKQGVELQVLTQCCQQAGMQHVNMFIH